MSALNDIFTLGVRAVLLLALLSTNGCDQLDSNIADCPTEHLGVQKIEFSGSYWGEGVFSLRKSESQSGVAVLSLTVFKLDQPSVPILEMEGVAYCEGNTLRAEFGASESDAAQLRILGGELTGLLDRKPKPSFGIWQFSVLKMGSPPEDSNVLAGYWRTFTRPIVGPRNTTK